LTDWKFLLITISLLVIALWFISKNYRQLYKGYKIDWSDKKFILRLLFLLMKAVLSLFVIIIMHNLYHNESYLYMMMTGIAYVAVSILQSEYARVGFQSRIKFILNYIERVFLKKKKEAQNLFRGLGNDEFDRYLVIVKVLLLIILFFVFLSQIGYFILGNLFYVAVISSFFLLTFLLNSLIYFGFTSLVLLQYAPGIIDISSANYYILSVAFVIIFIGMLFDNVFNERICIITGSFYIKDISFDDHYHFVYRTNRIAMYQHKTNRMYYVYYRSVGYVISFESYYDAKEYMSIIKKMIEMGKRFLIKNKKRLEEWL